MHIMKRENKQLYAYSTMRISSHDFFAGLELINDVMPESSPRVAGLTADAISIVC